MKTPIKIVSLLALATLTAAPLLRAADESATPPPQHRRGDGPRTADQRLQRLDQALKLTDAQKTQITDIWKQSADQGRAIREDTALTREARRDKMTALMKTTHDQVRAVLTPDQQKIFDTLKPERRGGRRNSSDGN